MRWDGMRGWAESISVSHKDTPSLHPGRTLDKPLLHETDFSGHGSLHYFHKSRTSPRPYSVMGELGHSCIIMTMTPAGYGIYYPLQT